MPEYSLCFQKESTWPVLAWVVTCAPGETKLHVRHGVDVETRTEWFCEAVWDGAFNDGGFDLTDVVSGSGARLRDGKVVFVSSGSISDRLHYINIKDQWWISNSLVCLAVVLELEVDPWYPWYYEDFSSICDGLDSYKQNLTTNKGDVILCYYRNLEWDGRRISTVEKPAPTREFLDYSSYRHFLENALKCMGENAQDRAREFSFKSLSTCSSGYDSLTISILARVMDNRQAICITTDRLDNDDNGTDLLLDLELEPLSFDRLAWRETAFTEVPFIAADACGRDSWISAASEHLNHRLLLAGHFGGNVWSDKPLMDARFCQDPDLSHPTPPGTSLAEYRLRKGFLVCLVPALGIASIDTIRALSNSSELAPWRVGIEYERPFARRVIEEAGIERGRFATRKTATSVHLFRRKEFERFFERQPGFRDFMQWLHKQSKAHAPPPIEDYPLTTSERERIQVPLFRHLFPWALARAKKLLN